MGFKPRLEGLCNTLEAEGYHVESRRLPLDVWTDVASARFYMFAVDARRAPRTALASALNLVDAVQAAQKQQPRVPIRDSLLVPGTLLWEQHVQPLFALSFGNVAQPFAGASTNC